MIDCNAFDGHYPFRTLANLSYELLVGGFAKYPITALFVSPIQAVFEEDPCPYNFRLVSRSGADSNDGRRFPKFYAAIALNPTLRNWRDQLSREVLRGKAVAIKLHPNYHSYHLTDGAARELLTACGEVGLPVIVQMRMQDTRSHHPLMQVPDVDITEVLEAAAATPQTQFVIGGIKWGEASGKANDINALPNVWLDISQCEVVDVLRRLIRLFGAKKLLFGTHAPFFYVKSAQLKLEEAQLTEEEKELITEKNAKELFGLSV